MRKITKTTILFVALVALMACQEDVIPSLDSQEFEIVEVLDYSELETQTDENDTIPDIR